jgi:hypothetical protein
MDYKMRVIEELKSVRALESAEACCRDRLAELFEKQRSVKGGYSDSTPVQNGGNRTEELRLNIISAKQEEERRLRDVIRRRRRFNTAWATLGGEDRRILELFYVDRQLKLNIF